MTLARAERDATYTPAEDYSGPVYGEPVVRTVTREVTFVLPPADNGERKAEITAEAILGVENFPELFAAVRQASWQPVVHDEACEMPQTGEDYRGAVCTGTALAPVPAVTAIRIGEELSRIRVHHALRQPDEARPPIGAEPGKSWIEDWR